MCMADSPDKPTVAPKVPEAAQAPKEAPKQVGTDDDKRRRGRRATVLNGNQGLMAPAVTGGATLLGGGAA